MSVKSPGLGAGGLANLANYATGTFTVTLTGMSPAVTGTASYVIIGNTITLYLPTLTGTSNAAGKGLSGIPALIRPTTGQQWFVTVVDSTLTSNVGRLTIGTDGTATLYIVTPATGALTTTFTATGTFTLPPITATYVQAP